jgi:hypothetical protein
MWVPRGTDRAEIMPRVLLALMALVLLCPQLAGADTEEKPTRFGVVVSAGDGVQPWRASALAHSVALDVSAYSRLDATTRPGADTSKCSAGNLPCVLAAHRKAGIEIVMFGTVRDDQLEYRLYQTWSEYEPMISRGRLVVSNTDEHQLRQGIRALLDPVLRAGGALAVKEQNTGKLPPTSVAAVIDRTMLGPVLGGVALLLALPFLIAGLGLRGNGGIKKVTSMRTFHWTVALWVALALLTYGASSWAEEIARWRWGILIAGGIAWGRFVIAVGRSVFPSLGGLDRVEHADVFRLLRAWSLVSLQRLVRVSLFFAPFFFFFWVAYVDVGVPTFVALTVLAPLWGLLVVFWYDALVESLAAVLDQDLVRSDPTEDNEWHQAVHGYFMGYVRRAGWPADDKLLDDILFLPGNGDEIHLYGGGLTPSRVVIGHRLLEFALAPFERPHDYSPKREHKLLWSEWNSGLVVPLEIDATVATPEERRPRHPPVPGETEHAPLGQPPTLAGYIEPAALDRRHAHRPNEDPLWLDWDPTEEHDGTDPSDKDFLFGALVYNLGAIQRHDDRRSTVALATRRWLRAQPRFVERVVNWIGAPFRLFFTRYPAILGDAFASLNFARHHLVQYLAWLHWRREDLLTARAFAPELEEGSTDILWELEEENKKTGERKKGEGIGATPRNRLAWMSHFFHDPVRSKTAIRLQRAVIATVAVAILIAFALGIKSAVDYHPTYVERMDKPAVDSPKPKTPKDPAP